MRAGNIWRPMAGSLKRFFLSRSTILVLILTALAAMLAGSFIPQSFLLTPAGLVKWRLNYPVFAPLAEKLGLLHIYTHPGFAILLALVVVSLLFSCIEQVKSAWHLTTVAAGGGGQQFPVCCMPAEAQKLVRARGYLQLGGSGAYRYVRHPWGYWGNSLLHLGMLVVIASSLWIALTQQRGSLHLAAGETHQSTKELDTTETGLLAGNYLLPLDIRMERVDWESGQGNALKRLSSTLTFLKKDAVVGSKKTEINSILIQGGDRIYQGTDYGHAFYLEVTAPGRDPETFQLLMDHPKGSERYSYKDFSNLLGNRDLLRVKYSLVGNVTSSAEENPHLVLRVDDSRGAQIGQLPLDLESEGSIGPYHFRLRLMREWSSLIFVRLTGIAGVFAGFFIIVLGSILNYFTPPREILLQVAAEGGTIMLWRATKFNALYQDEFEQLKRELGTGASHG